MRNLKKVLTLVLTVAMLLSVMVVGTGAAFSDQDQIKNKEAVDVCTTLNIIAGMEDGSYRPANNVTRAQMCKMICVALNGGKEPTLGTNATPTFSDVRTDPSSSWAESFIESCNSQGIVSGVGGGRFSPSGSVTGTQAARMLLVALGYRADQEGFTGDAWAINVNTRASAKGLYAGIESIDANAALSRDNAAQMIWNALNAYEVEYVSQLVTVDGTLTSKLVAQDRVVSSTNDKITLLEDKYEADTAIGTFSGNSKMDGGIKDGNIEIDNAKINGRTLTTNTTFQFKSDLDLKYLGEEIKVLYRDNNDGVKGELDEKDTIYGVYITGATTVYNITKNDLQTTSTPNKIKFNDKEYKVSTAVPASTASDVVAVDINYGADSVNVKAGYANSNKQYSTFKGAFDSLAAVSADTIKFIVKDGEIVKAYVTEYNVGKVMALTSSKVTISGVGGSIDIDGNDIYSGIAKDDVVVYTQFYSGTRADALFTVTKAETVQGEVSAYKLGTDPAVKAVTVNGTSYDVDNETLRDNLTDDAVATQAAVKDQIGEDTIAYLMNGMVVALQKTSDTTSSYALVVDDNDTVTNGDISIGKVQLLMSDNSKVVYDVHKDSTKQATDFDAGDLVKYTVGSNNTVKIAQVFNTSGDKSNTQNIWDADTKVVGSNAGVAAANCVLYVKVDAGTDYRAYNIRDLKTNTAGSAKDVYYALSSSGQVVAAYVDLGKKPTGAADATMYGIVTADNGVVRMDGDSYRSYTVWTGTESITVYLDGATGTNDLVRNHFYTFDRTSNNYYDDSDFVELTDGAHGDLTVDDVAVDSYSSSDQILSYWTSLTATTNNGVTTYAGSGAKPATTAIDKNVVIVGIDQSDTNAASAEGVVPGKFDTTTGYANAKIVVDDDVIVAIFVESTGEKNINGAASALVP